MSGEQIPRFQVPNFQVPRFKVHALPAIGRREPGMSIAQLVRSMAILGFGLAFIVAIGLFR
jgi:hypothetical protein